MWCVWAGGRGGLILFPAPAPRVKFYLGSKRYRDSELTHGFLRCGLNGVPLKSMPTQNLRMCPLFGNRLFELR